MAASRARWVAHSSSWQRSGCRQRSCGEAGGLVLLRGMLGEAGGWGWAVWQPFGAGAAAPDVPSHFTHPPSPAFPPSRRRRKGEAEGATPVRLRGYQQRMVEEARGGGNWIFVAPTNSGKTAVAKEHAAHVLGQGPQARVVFVTPTVALATQQAGERGGGGGAQLQPAQQALLAQRRLPACPRTARRPRPCSLLLRAPRLRPARLLGGLLHQRQPHRAAGLAQDPGGEGSLYIFYLNSWLGPLSLVASRGRLICKAPACLFWAVPPSPIPACPGPMPSCPRAPCRAGAPRAGADAADPGQRAGRRGGALQPDRAAGEQVQRGAICRRAYFSNFQMSMNAVFSPPPGPSSAPSCLPPPQVLDECHHATGNHAVNQLLRHYHASQERTQVRHTGAARREGARPGHSAPGVLADQAC